jgi:hypothetical protein
VRLNDAHDVASLDALAAAAVGLLVRGDIKALADRYGYILAHGRDPEAAIRNDLAHCLAALGAGLLAPDGEWSEPKVGFFEANSTNLVALVECVVPTDVGCGVLVELVVTKNGLEDHLYLEEISPAEHPAFS